jgi:hypothetical protein
MTAREEMLHWDHICGVWAGIGWLVFYRSPQAMHVTERQRATDATPAEIVEFTINELREALECCEPATEHNGRHADSFHVGCCVLRAWGSLLRLRKLLAGVTVAACTSPSIAPNATESPASVPGSAG